MIQKINIGQKKTALDPRNPQSDEAFFAEEFNAMIAAFNANAEFALLAGATLNAKSFDVYPNINEDQAPAINALLNLAATLKVKTVVFPAGTYTILSQITKPPGVELLGAGQDTTIFDATGASFSNFPNEAVIYATGSYQLIGKLSGSTLRFAGKQIICDTDVTLKKGDIICVSDATDFSYNAARAYYREGEYLTVSADVTNAKVIPVDTHNYGNYPNASATSIYKMNFNTGGIGNLTVKAMVLTDQMQRMNCITMEYCGYSFVRNVKALNATSSCLRTSACYKMAIENVSNHKFDSIVIENGSTSYGLSINGQSITVKDSDFFGYRHGITFTGSTSFMPSRFCTVTGCKCTSGVLSGMDCHGNAEYIYIVDNHHFDGLMLAGGNIVVRNNTIYNFPLRGAIEFRELKNLNFTIDNNRIVITNVPATSSTVVVIDEGTTDPTVGNKFFFRKNTIIDATDTGATKRIDLQHRSASSNIEFYIEDNIFEFTKLGSAAIAAYTINVTGASVTNKIGAVYFRNNKVSGQKTLLKNVDNVHVSGGLFENTIDTALEASDFQNMYMDGAKFNNWGKDYSFVISTGGMFVFNGNFGKTAAASARAYAVVNVNDVYEGMNAFKFPADVFKTGVANTYQFAAGTNPIVTAPIEQAATKLTGTRFYNSSWSDGNFSASKTGDGNFTTYWNASDSIGQVYTGFEFGTPKIIKRFGYAPRPNAGNNEHLRIRGAKLQGSNTSNADGFVDLFTIPMDEVPPENPTACKYVDITDQTPYKYVRVLFAAGMKGNASELEFWGY